MADMGPPTVLEYFLVKHVPKNIQMNIKNHEKAWKSCLDMEATAQAYKDFQSRYLDKYSPTLGENLSENFIGRIGEYSLDHTLIQLYSHYGIIPSENNPFYIHMKNMENIFPEFYKRNIMDIAAGQIPALAEMIAGEQVKINAGTITAIDPELLITKADPKYNKRLILLRKKFTPSASLSKACDLIISISPCPERVAMNVLTYAYEHSIEFYISLCGAIPYELSNYASNTDLDIETASWTGENICGKTPPTVIYGKKRKRQVR